MNNAIFRIRWRLFKLLSHIGWWVCPEPYKTDLKRRQMLACVPQWKDLP